MAVTTPGAYPPSTVTDARCDSTLTATTACTVAAAQCAQRASDRRVATATTAAGITVATTTAQRNAEYDTSAIIGCSTAGARAVATGRRPCMVSASSTLCTRTRIGMPRRGPRGITVGSYAATLAPGNLVPTPA